MPGYTCKLGCMLQVALKTLIKQ